LPSELPSARAWPLSPPADSSDYGEVLKQGRLKRKIVIYYLVLAARGELRPGVEEGIEEVRWMDVPEAIKQIGRPRVQAVLRSALTHLNP